MSKPFLSIVKEEEGENEAQHRASFISDLFDQARRGAIPRHRELLPHEPATLNERHLQAIMMRCMGMRQKDIAISLGFTDSRVSIMLNHPDATYIIDKIQGLTALSVTNIEERLERLTPKAVDAIEAVFDSDDEDPKAVNSRIAKARLGFSLLEHRGHGVKKPLEVKHEHAFRIDAGAASLLGRALRESNSIGDATYSVTEGPGSGVEGSGRPEALPSGIEAPPLGVSQGPLLDPKAN